ncbi:MAG: dicarboxylate/amino acid:cation symporter [Bdellovibrionales bacterium]
MTKQTPFDQHLWVKILFGLVVGIGVGLALSPESGALFEQELTKTIAEWIELPGVVFLGLLKMVVVPLVICSIVVGIADSGALDFVKSIGSRIVIYFLITSSIAIFIGMSLTYAIQPGDVIPQEFIDEAIASQAERGTPKTLEGLTIPQRIANIIPTNPAKAQLEKNMLQIVIASLLVGIALLSLSNKTMGKPILSLCQSGQSVCMKIIEWAMKIAPYAVFGLMANVVIDLGFDAVTSVALYMITVLAGLLSMLGVYLILVKFVGGVGIFEFLKGVREAQIIAFSSSSSAATIPVSLKCAEEKLGVPKKIAGFTVPLGATINMDGTGLYQAVAAIFLTQVFGVDLTLSEMALLLVTTVGASIGTPGIPGIGIVVLATILTGIGVPAEGIALILGVDRILDMCRTTINITGDLTATVVMNRLIKS